VATVGTTSSGAIDSIGEIGEVGKFHIIDTAEADKSVKDFPSCYLHIDSAVSTPSSTFQDLTSKWAGVANALPEHRKLLCMDEINKYADSFSTNLHKWGLVGFDCCQSSPLCN
jgi:aromatic-L-amino-acid decarboxylase